MKAMQIATQAMFGKINVLTFQLVLLTNNSCFKLPIAFALR